MKWFALLLLAGALTGGDRSLNASGMVTLRGIVQEDRCMGPNCATQCPVSKDPAYTLQTDSEAWVLTDGKSAARYLGMKVVVRGRVGEGARLAVASITPAG